MSMKIVAIPDSFKGSLSAARVAAILKKAADETFDSAEFLSLPLADGGEGTLDVLHRALGGVFFSHDVTGACGQPVRARYLSVGDTAYVEFAEAAGFSMRLPGFNAANTTSVGVGQIMGHAIEAGHRRIVVALGGSMTNDCGCGMAAALGVGFEDARGRRFLPIGNTLSAIKAIRLNPLFFSKEGVRIEALCDVTNPLYGPDGAARVFGPQKGLTDEEITRLDEGAKTIDQIFQMAKGPKLNTIAGAGAAGGAGAGVVAFLNGRLRSGTETVLELMKFDELVRGADLIVTGEGRVDAQTLSGKLVSGVARRAGGRPVVVMTGEMSGDPAELYALGVTAVLPIARGPRTREDALAQSAADLLASARDLFRLTAALKA